MVCPFGSRSEQSNRRINGYVAGALSDDTAYKVGLHMITDEEMEAYKAVLRKYCYKKMNLK